jgi:tetratricopeptide (TPR) repeat protein
VVDRGEDRGRRVRLSDDVDGRSQCPPVARFHVVGWCHAHLGQHDEALAACQQALGLFQELGSPVGQAVTLDSLGYTHHGRRDHGRAVTCYHRALTLFRDLGDLYQEALTTVNLGDTHHSAGDTEAARDTWQTALDIFCKIGHADHPDADAVRAKLADFGPPEWAPPPR